MSKFGLLGLVLICLIFTPTYALSVSNETISKPNNLNPDLALVSGKKFPLIVNERSYDIYYGIILGQSSDQDYEGAITSMSIVPEKKSLLITFDNILQTDNIWVRFPNEVISADNEKFVLFVDGIEKGYELSSHGSDTRLGFIIPTGTHEVEIMGNSVIPEFSTRTLVVFSMVFCIVTLLTKNYMKINT